MTTNELARHLPAQIHPGQLTILLETLRRRFPADPPTYGQLREALRLAINSGATKWSRSASIRPEAWNRGGPASGGTSPERNTPEIPPAGWRPVASAAMFRLSATLRVLALRLSAWATELQSPVPRSSQVPAPSQPGNRAPSTAAIRPPGSAQGHSSSSGEPFKP